MNEVIRQLNVRKSVRTFTAKPIGERERSAILEAAFQAPTAGNQQMYTVLDIADSALRHTLAELCDHQPFIEKAALCLVFVADLRRWMRAYELAGCTPRPLTQGDILLAVTDSCIAAQNAVVAAESMGIGSCYIGDVLENCEAMRAALRLPKDVMPAAMLVFGYGDEAACSRRKPARFSEELMVCKNIYTDADDDTLRRSFIDRAARDGREKFDFDTDVQAFCARKYNSEFSREMSRSVEKYLRAFLPDNGEE